MSGQRRTLPCPVPLCSGKTHLNEILCPRHWFRVPKKLRDAVWLAYMNEPESEKHRYLVAAAIREASGTTA